MATSSSETSSTPMMTTVSKLLAVGKGILAADESTGTIGKRFDLIKLENNQDNRRSYRKLLFTTPNLNKYISGVITYEETLFDTDESGNRLIQPLLDADIIVGVKADGGLLPFGEEQVTRGLEDLAVRCHKFYEAGARFAKWRCVYQIDSRGSLPTPKLVTKNAETLATYALICQQHSLVPIVEPEVLMDGDHNIETCEQVCRRVLNELFYQMVKLGVNLECTLLKTNFVHQGTDSKNKATSKEIAWRTMRVFRDTVPLSVPGIVFLSGGMEEEESCEVLGQVAKLAGDKDWKISFSYGRALQHSAMLTWRGKEDTVRSAQSWLLRRAETNSKAIVCE